MKHLIKLLIFANLLVAFSALSLMAHGSRYHALPVIGVGMSIGGLYNMCKEEKYYEKRPWIRKVGGLVLLLSGICLIITSNEIIDEFDMYMKQRRWERGSFRWKDILPK